MPAMPEGLHALTPHVHYRRGRKWENIERRTLALLKSPRRGFNLRYFERIVRLPEKLDKMAKHNKWSWNETMKRKALLTAWMGAYWVDHIIEAERLAIKSIDDREMTKREEGTLWEHYYKEFLQHYRTEKRMRRLEDIQELKKSTLTATPEQMKERQLIADLMEHLTAYGTPPKTTLLRRHKAFQKHKKQMEQIIGKELEMSEKERMTELDNEVQHILTQRTIPKIMGEKICEAACIYADVEERRPLEEEKKRKSWTMHYNDAMFMIYDKIKDIHPELIEVIAKLD